MSDDIHAGHRKRVKQEYRDSGLSHFPKHKILELALYYAIPRVNTNETGHRLLDRFGSIPGVLDAPIELLQEVPGISIEAATYLKLLADMAKVYMDDLASSDGIINSIESAKAFMSAKFLGETSECIYLTCLGKNGKILYSKKIAEGSPESVGISPVAIIKPALRVDAVTVLIAHNHPYGISVPSGSDVRTTCLLCEELRRIDIKLLDHVIVAPDGICSMSEQGMLPKRR